MTNIWMVEMADKLDLEELERLEREATLGLWGASQAETDLCADDGTRGHTGYTLDGPITYGDYESWYLSGPDIELICALRNAALKLFERVRELREVEKMRCETCYAIAPENEKDWPKTECSLCVLRDRIAELERQLKEAESRYGTLQTGVDRFIAACDRQAAKDAARSGGGGK